MNGRTPAQRVAQRFGLPLLAYVANASVDEMAEVVGGDRTLEGDRARVFESVIQALTQVLVQAAFEGVPDALLVTQLGYTLEPRNRNVFNVWREQAGGEISIPVVGDAVVDSLSELAVDAYPLLLVAAEAPEITAAPSSLFIHPTFGHPAFGEFGRLVVDDPELSALFPSRNDDLPMSAAYVHASTGRGGTLQLATLPSALIQSAYSLMRLRGQLRLDELARTLGELITIVRAVLRDGSTTLPSFIGFNNVAIPADGSIEMPWGIARSYVGVGLDVIPTQARPPVLGGSETPLGFILETEYPYELHVSPWEPSAGGDLSVAEFPPVMRDAFERLDRISDLTSLCFALAVERDPPVACGRVWTLIIDPLSHGGASWSPFSLAPIQFYEADDAAAEDVGAWAHRIAGVDDSKIRVAQRRLVSSLSQRLDPVDGFIDAVIAWENLFGHRSGELSFRISSAMASLLTRDTQQRLDLQDRISRQYGRRSGLIHGGATLSPADATAERDSALAVALGALRSLYLDFPGLIPDPDRSKKLVLSL